MKRTSNASCVVFVGALVAAAVFVSSCSSKSAKDEVRFEPYSEQALQVARGLNKPILVFATAEWCPPCRSLHAGALTEKSVKTALEPFARLEIDCTDRENAANGAILEGMKIKMIPALVFMDAQGTETARLVGDQEPDVIINAAKKAQGR